MCHHLACRHADTCSPILHAHISTNIELNTKLFPSLVILCEGYEGFIFLSASQWGRNLIFSFLEEWRIMNRWSRDVLNSMYNLQPHQKKKEIRSVPPRSLALNDLCLDHDKRGPDSCHRHYVSIIEQSADACN